jgi:hypothetical protein
MPGLTSPPKEVVVRNFIALKNRSSSVGFERSKLGSNGKHDNYQTTEDDKEVQLSSQVYMLRRRQYSLDLPREGVQSSSLL